MKTTSRIRLESVGKSTLGQIDLLICSASFESRCLSLPQAIVREEIQPSNVLIATNEDYKEFLSKNLSSLKKLFPNSSTIPLRTDDPIQSMDSLLSGINKAWKPSRPTRVLVDITTFTRESLLMLIQCLWRRASENEEIMLAYTRALEYDVGKDNTDKKLSQGIREIRSVLGFPGDLWPSRPTHLLVMAGFESERAVALVTKCEPSIVSIGIADSAEEDTSAHQSVNESRKKEIIRQINNLAIPVQEFMFSGYDCIRAADDVSRQIERVAKEEGGISQINTILAPMNTKISSIGAAIVGRRLPSVQLCYAQAELYNYARYSTPSDTVYFTELPQVDGIA